MATRSTTHTHQVTALTTVDGAAWACAATVRLSPVRGGTPLVTDLFGFERYDAEGRLVERRDELDPLGEADVIEALEAAAVRKYLEETIGDDSLEEALADRLYDHQRDQRRAEGWN